MLEVDGDINYALSLDLMQITNLEMKYSLRSLAK